MKPTDATHRRFGIAAVACLLALAARQAQNATSTDEEPDKPT